MDTKTLYTDDSYKTKFDAYVNSCVRDDISGNYFIELDQTCFYPEGGGQPADNGSIGNCEIFDVQMRDGKIVHLSKTPIPSFSYVSCEVNFERRFDFMQCHSGQHLFSAYLYRKYDINTIGFHLSENSLTIDIDNFLSQEQIDDILTGVNDLIYKNLMYIAHFPDGDELKKYDLRKQPSVENDIRLIEIEDFDIVPCGGTHVRSTGELGAFIIQSVENYKGANRIKFSFGKRSQRYSALQSQIIKDLVNKLSLPIEELAEAIELQFNKIDSIRDRNIFLENQLSSLMMKEICANSTVISGVHIINVFDDILSNKGFQELINNVIAELRLLPFILVGANANGSKCQIVIINNTQIDTLDAKEIVRTLCEKYNLKGGGTKMRSQLGVDDRSTAQEVFKYALEYILKSMEHTIERL